MKGQGQRFRQGKVKKWGRKWHFMGRGRSGKGTGKVKGRYRGSRRDNQREKKEKYHEYILPHIKYMLSS